MKSYKNISRTKLSCRQEPESNPPQGQNPQAGCQIKFGMTEGKLPPLSFQRKLESNPPQGRNPQTECRRQKPAKKLLSLYIHWPFCLSKCPYCDFFSKAGSKIDEEKIITGYLSDLDYYHDLTSERQIDTIFFGGGTPSLLKAKNIEKLIDHTAKLWPTSPNIEISLEANPNSNHPQMFQDLKQAGINRLSLGVQALNEKDLKFLGRSHGLSEALQAIEEIKSCFDNHSIDLIYARPAQKQQDWAQELKQTVSFGLTHISLYQLTIEPGTLFYKQNIRPLAEQAAAKLYEFTYNFLQDSGYRRYEVSNFAKSGKECRHNQAYWHGQDYIGIGQGAHGRLRLGQEAYAFTHPRKKELLTPLERAEELLIMGLRVPEGINKKAFADQCGLDFDNFINQQHAAKLEQLGLIINRKDHLHLTPKGFLLLDKIIEELAI